MIKSDSVMFNSYLTSLVDRIFKILPLYEEKNEGLVRYIDSLVFELQGLETVITDMSFDTDYIILLATMRSLESESKTLTAKTSTVKREVFKCINLVKRIKESGDK